MGDLNTSHLHPASWLHRIPDSITWEEGALLEPLSVALAGIERSGLKLGDPLLICGAGAFVFIESSLSLLTSKLFLALQVPSVSLPLQQHTPPVHRPSSSPST